jgi:A/G-specific adenine glycosylase
VPVDGNVERVVTRLFAIEEALPAAKPAIKRMATSLLPPRRSGDFAQALMDLGATLCSQKKPACSLCPWSEPCAARALARQEEFPRKAPKREGRLRRGAAFVALRADGCVLLRTRPDKGLLGGMTEVPGSAWTHDFELADALAAAPLDTRWRKLPGLVKHVFTHFPLELTIFSARVPARTRAPQGARWVRLADADSEALPTVMRKVLAHAADMQAAATAT